MTKVFCKDCVYNGPSKITCYSHTNRRDTYYVPAERLPGRASELNASNDCPNFKTKKFVKLWKFLIPAWRQK